MMKLAEKNREGKEIDVFSMRMIFFVPMSAQKMSCREISTQKKQAAFFVGYSNKIVTSDLCSYEILLDEVTESTNCKVTHDAIPDGWPSRRGGCPNMRYAPNMRQSVFSPLITDFGKLLVWLDTPRRANDICGISLSYSHKWANSNRLSVFG
jgi:hypothetical protein